VTQTLEEPIIEDIIPEQRFVAKESHGYHGWGVWERRDESFTWAANGTTQEVAEALALFLNAVVPDTMHQWAVRRMLMPVSEVQVRT
jgi:hypothetical protein